MTTIKYRSPFKDDTVVALLANTEHGPFFRTSGKSQPSEIASSQDEIKLAQEVFGTSFGEDAARYYSYSSSSFGATVAAATGGGVGT